MIVLRFASVEWTPWGCVSFFHDQTRYGAHPHTTPGYYAVAARLGYQGDTLAYAREHELCHHLIGEAFDRPSAVIWALAHGQRPEPYAAAAEEALAMTLQRFARCNEQPMIEGVDWSMLRDKLLLAEAT